jgi:hypothetical protein
MEKKNDGANLIGRRRALQVIGVGFGAASGIFALSGCNNNSAPSTGPTQGAAPAAPVAASNSCADKVETDDAAKTLRKTLQYKEKSDNPDKKCSLCAQFEAGKYGNCGGCKLFGGAVNPEGACLSFAPKVAPGAAPGAAPAAPGAAPAAPAAPGAAPAAPAAPKKT